MAKSKSQKKEILAMLDENIRKAKSIIFTKFNALPVDENEELRKELKKENNEYHVAKKTLLSLAFSKSDIKDIDARKFDGKISVIFGFQDEVSPAKIVAKFRKGKEEKIEFLGGILENKYLTAGEIEELAKLPSKTELYAKIVGSLNAPVSGFVNVLAGNLKSLVYVLNAIKDNK